MRYSNPFTLVVAASLVTAHPHHQPAKRAVSPDNTCGPENGYTCPDNMPCCSQWGWCGSGSDYCAAGCQPAFGTCDDTGGDPDPPSSPDDPPTQSPAENPGSSPTSSSGGVGSVRDVPRPKIGSVPYGSVITSCVNNGDIALTFDDGPYIYTPYLLDLLGRYNVKATFFVVGNNGNGDIDKVAEWTNTITRMFDEGHQIASHTWDHPDLTTLSSNARREQMYRIEAALANILGFFPTYMRPPYLAFDSASAADMADLGYHVISTNLDTKDYANTSPELIVNSQQTFEESTASDPASSSFIVLNHDIHEQTVYTLTEFEIERLTSRGYRAVTVGECLGDSAANWYRNAPSGNSRARSLAPANEPTARYMQKREYTPPLHSCTYVGDLDSI